MILNCKTVPVVIVLCCCCCFCFNINHIQRLDIILDIVACVIKMLVFVFLVENWTFANVWCASLSE